MRILLCLGALLVIAGCEAAPSGKPHPFEDRLGSEPPPRDWNECSAYGCPR